jgi:hypothetical protein
MREKRIQGINSRISEMWRLFSWTTNQRWKGKRGNREVVVHSWMSLEGKEEGEEKAKEIDGRVRSWSEKMLNPGRRAKKRKRLPGLNDDRIPKSENYSEPVWLRPCLTGRSGEINVSVTKAEIPYRSMIAARWHINDRSGNSSLEDCMFPSNLFPPDCCAIAVVEMTRTRTGGMNVEDEERPSWDFPSFSEYACSSRQGCEIDQNRILAIAFVVYRLGGRGSQSNLRASVWGMDRYLRLHPKLMLYVRTPGRVNRCSRTTVGGWNVSI